LGVDDTVDDARGGGVLGVTGGGAGLDPPIFSEIVGGGTTTSGGGGRSTGGGGGGRTSGGGVPCGGRKPLPGTNSKALMFSLLMAVENYQIVHDQSGLHDG
jgi:hypothetical protein